MYVCMYVRMYVRTYVRTYVNSIPYMNIEHDAIIRTTLSKEH